MYSVDETGFTHHYTHEFPEGAQDCDGIYDMCFLEDGNQTNHNWLLMSKHRGDLYYLDCNDLIYNETSLASILYCRARSLTRSVNPTTGRNEVICSLDNCVDQEIQYLEIEDNLYFNYRVVSGTNLYWKCDEIILGNTTETLYCITHDATSTSPMSTYYNVCEVDRTAPAAPFVVNAYSIDTPNESYCRGVCANFEDSEMLIHQYCSDHSNNLYNSNVVRLELDSGQVHNCYNNMYCLPAQGQIWLNLYGKTRYVHDSERDIRCFITPSRDGSLWITDYTIGAEPVVHQITSGATYVRTILSNDGNTNIAWFPELPIEDERPVHKIIMTDTRTGSNTIIENGAPFYCLDVLEANALILVPHFDEIYAYGLEDGVLRHTYTPNIVGEIMSVSFIDDHFYIAYFDDGVYAQVFDSAFSAVSNPMYLGNRIEHLVFTHHENQEVVSLIASDHYYDYSYLVVFSDDTGEIIESIDFLELDAYTIKAVSSTGNRLYILVNGDDYDSVYSYDPTTGLLSTFCVGLAINDILYLPKESALCTLKYMTSTSGYVSYIMLYDAAGSCVGASDQIAGVAINMIYNQQTNRILVYTPVVCVENSNPIACMYAIDLDELEAEASGISLEYGYHSDEFPFHLPWTDLHIHPETGDIIFTPKNTSNIIKFTDESDTRAIEGGKWRWLSFPQLSRERVMILLMAPACSIASWVVVA